jgi:hypothetical protein
MLDFNGQVSNDAQELPKIGSAIRDKHGVKNRMTWKKYLAASQ